MKAALPLLALTLLAICLPIATAPLEIAMAITLTVCLACGRWTPNPWLQPTLLWIGAWLLAAVPHGSPVIIESLGFGWALTALVVVPPLVGLTDRDFVIRRGIEAAALIAIVALLQRLTTGQAASAGFSHHLTLAYALLPPLAVATARGQWREVIAIGAGILATGSEGAVIPFAVAILASRTKRPVATALIGAVLLLGALFIAQD